MLTMRLASTADRWTARARRLAEKWGWPQPWLQEFQAYLGEPRMTQEEFWVRYTLLRMDAQPHLDHPLTEQEARAFYMGHRYMLWRNVVHRRHTSWRRVLASMPETTGHLLEFGCATAPVAAWIASRRPRWRYTLVDLDSPHRAYGVWRVAQQVATHAVMVADTMPNHGSQFDVVTVLDVFEHLPDPLRVARQAVAVLRPGGALHTNFVANSLRNDLDLCGEVERDATMAYLHTALDLVWTDGIYCRWRAR